LGAVAHDVKTPLTVIRGQTQLLQRRLRRQEPDHAEAFQGMLTAIERAALRATQMMESLVDVVQIGAGRRLDLKREAVDLVALVPGIVEAIGHGQPHPIRVQAVESSLIGCWDRSRIERVLTNLLGNAIKFSPDGSEIVVRVDQETDNGRAWAVMSVTDRGIGIPAADLPHVFERYRRGGNVTGQIAGSGIGLSAAQQIVAQHGGTIAVSSVEGQGTTVTVRLPIAESTALDPATD
jgi:signal transduction histidine kinase